MLERLEASASGPPASTHPTSRRPWRPSGAVRRRSSTGSLQLLVKQRRLVRLDTLVFHHDVLDRLKADIAGRKTTAPAVAPPSTSRRSRTRYGLSRKFAIPLLEFLDRERVTRRAGDVRIVL